MKFIARPIVRRVRAFRDRARVARAIQRASRVGVRGLWIGDSHVIYFSGGPPLVFGLNAGGEAAVWLGPRLMYGIARDGFPEPLIPELRGVNFELARVPVVVALGEIDCRVHLVGRVRHQSDLAFVDRYIERVAELRVRLGIRHVFVLGPTPPSDLGLLNPMFPRKGTLAERVEITRAVERRLRAASVECPGVAVVIISDELVDMDTGALAAHFTDDGCHVNALGAELVRAKLNVAFEAVANSK